MTVVKRDKGLSEDIFMCQFPNYEHFIGQVTPPLGAANRAQVAPPTNAKLPINTKAQK